MPLACNLLFVSTNNILSNYYPWISIFLFEYLTLGLNKTSINYCIIILHLVMKNTHTHIYIIIQYKIFLLLKRILEKIL